MRLLVFAHHGEAASFLRELKADRVAGAVVDGLYQGVGGGALILLTGEGNEAGAKVAATLGRYEGVSEVINFGTAGALDDSLKLDTCHSIRTVYSEADKKSFSSTDHKAVIDLISATKRVDEHERRRHLAPHAPLVDRELYQIALACFLTNRPFYAFKVISDFAENVKTDQIKEASEKYSEILLAKYCEFTAISGKPSLKHAQHVRQVQQDSLPPEFHLSSSQRKQLDTLLHSLQVKFKETSSAILHTAGLEKLKASGLRPKERTRSLLQNLRHTLNPDLKKISLELEALVEPLTRAGVKVGFANDFESDQVDLSFSITTGDDVATLRKALAATDFASVSAVLNGERGEGG